MLKFEKKSVAKRLNYPVSISDYDSIVSNCREGERFGNKKLGRTGKKTIVEQLDALSRGNVKRNEKLVRIIAVQTRSQTERLLQKVTDSSSLPVRTKRNVWGEKIGPQREVGS